MRNTYPQLVAAHPIFRQNSCSKELPMPKFTILSRVDAYVDYTTEVEADSLEEAVDLAYDGDPSIKWKEQGVVEFDARHVVALDADGAEIESYSRGKG